MVYTRIGIIGGGQLGRMMAFEAKKMGFTVTVLDPTPQSPAGQVSDHQIIANYTDKHALEELARVSDVITVEVEITDEHILHRVLEEIIKKGIPVHPAPQTLSVVQDKLRQKEFLKNHRIETSDFFPVETPNDIVKAGTIFGYPLVLKARTGAYDGRGNAVIQNARAIDQGVEKLTGRKLYVERFVPFVKELAVLVARDLQDKIVVYPVVETIHKNNICHFVYAPASIGKIVAKRAEIVGRNVVKHLRGAGVYAIEMFLTKDGKVLVNEIAPRVHNSGHYTIEASHTSQFEQHIRAISGLPLGDPSMRVSSAVMINILGDRNAKAEVIGLEKALVLPNTTVHFYGKLKTKQERKMGHITAIGNSFKESLKKAMKARKYINI